MSRPAKTEVVSALLDQRNAFKAFVAARVGNEAELLRRVDLQGQPVSAAAIAVGMTANNASVTLHRARAELRKKLQEFCGSCADGGCLDCTCGERPACSRPCS